MALFQKEESGAARSILPENMEIDVLSIDFAGGSATANDTINLNFGGTSNDLDTVTLNGNAGADTFNIFAEFNETIRIGK